MEQFWWETVSKVITDYLGKKWSVSRVICKLVQPENWVTFKLKFGEVPIGSLKWMVRAITQVWS